ncbi:beta-1,4-galactosyltransferase 4-like [Paramacrobiotus metropolitanus]|uniref:beta-1,4-galactosyltransferase 4-like n=1 Tax=Paramacrobiotus metropolitanus TaxID=2943436 RepID=UPI002445B050|nr:beta-1,4-galactosyltransferase 4-like [Paramacrobiotus metropolitanus]
MLSDGTLSSRISVNRGIIIILCCTVSLLTVFSNFTGSPDNHVRCPPLLVSLDANGAFVCNASGYYDALTQRPLRLLIFYDKNDVMNLPLCDVKPATLIGRRNVSLEAHSEEDIAADNPKVLRGGRYRPSGCVPRQRLRVAVIVAYRDRQEHLQILLNNLHPFLQRQQLDYTVFLVEQAGNATFNRGKLFNVGFVEANKLREYPCFVFHDVDLLPENDANAYSCPQYPTLLSSAMEKNKYRPIYADYFGGVVSFSSRHFRQVNGFPNLYWGWGGEDDDLSLRVRTRLGKLLQEPADTGQYTMLKHEKDAGNPVNPQRFKLLNAAAKRFETDGLSSLSYSVVKLERKPLYTWILVDIGQPG